MLLLDAKKLWVEGGYDLQNDFAVSIARIKRFGKEQGLPDDVVELLLIDLFVELRENPTKYRTVGNVCTCGCAGTNSGTNIIHVMFTRLQEVAKAEKIRLNEQVADAFNQRVIAYMERENAAYTAKYGPTEVKWYHMPTFKRILGIK